MNHLTTCTIYLEGEKKKKKEETKKNLYMYIRVKVYREINNANDGKLRYSLFETIKSKPIHDYIHPPIPKLHDRNTNYEAAV